MTTPNFTTAKLEDYYNNRFQKDLHRFFFISKNDNIEVATGFKTDLYSAIRYRTPVGLLLLQDLSTFNYRKRDYQQENEEELMFVALISFMFSAEQIIVYRSEGYSESELASCVNAFGFPLIPSIHRMGLESFLSIDLIKSEFYKREEVEMLRDAMSVVKPFMLSKLIAFLKTWDNGSYYLKNEFVDVFGAYIGISIKNGLTIFHKSYYEYRGLTGLQITHKDYESYKQQFYADFKKYFSCASEIEGYLEVLSLNYLHNLRWEDGNPGGSLKNNLIFACFLLYMTMVQQSILEHAKEAEIDFHKCTGWPMISSGPGSGPYLHPLMMLEEAGLSPMKYESPILLECVRIIFPWLRQDINAVLNGRESVMKDIPAGKRFKEAIKGLKKVIKQYLDDEEEVVVDLLSKWQTHPDSRWFTLLDKEDIPVQKEIK